MHKIMMQLHGGGGGGGSVEPIKQSAPGSTAAATIDSATEGERQSLLQNSLKLVAEAIPIRLVGSLPLIVSRKCCWENDYGYQRYAA